MSKARIATSGAPNAVGPYSQGIDAGDTVYCSGQVGLDPQTNELVSGGLEAQTERALRNLGAVLEAAGLGYADVVKTTASWWTSGTSPRSTQSTAGSSPTRRRPVPRSRSRHCQRGHGWRSRLSRNARLPDIAVPIDPARTFDTRTTTPVQSRHPWAPTLHQPPAARQDRDQRRQHRARRGRSWPRAWGRGCGPACPRSSIPSVAGPCWTTSSRPPPRRPARPPARGHLAGHGAVRGVVVPGRASRSRSSHAVLPTPCGRPSERSSDTAPEMVVLSGDVPLVSTDLACDRRCWRSAAEPSGHRPR